MTCGTRSAGEGSLRLRRERRPDTCPVLQGTKYVDWNLPDPAGLCLEEVRELREVIEQRVSSLPL